MDAGTIGKILAAVLTLMVFSYLIGNNPFYRLAQHLFVGVSIGYATLLVIGVLRAQLSTAFTTNNGALNPLLYGVPLLLGLYLFVIRIIRPTARGGTVALNIAVSTAAALALGGALAGTLVPQVLDTMRPLRGDNLDLFAIIGNLIVIVGVAAALFYFSFRLPASNSRSQIGTLVAESGRWLIIFALGAMLGTLAVTFVAALDQRVQFIFTIFS